TMRVLVEGLAEGPRVLVGPAYHHVARVLRARVGDEVTLFDGAGREAPARVTRIWPTEVLLQVGSVRSAAPAPVSVTLLLALLKGEKMDWVVQKATELGVAHIVPMTTEHAVVKLAGSRGESRKARWEKIAAEAARQSGRVDLPGIAEVTDLTAAFEA